MKENLENHNPEIRIFVPRFGHTCFLGNNLTLIVMDNGYFAEFILLAAIVGGILAFLIIRRLREE